jgi:hypothetical protein
MSRCALWGLALLLTLMATLETPNAGGPAEVGNLDFVDRETLVWDTEPLADRYHLYRGYLHELSSIYYGTAIGADISGTTHTDPTLPPPTRAFFYLVTAASLQTEGTMGFLPTTGGPVERTNNFPWPGIEVAGSWEDPSLWPAVAIHAVLLPSGDVLIWKGHDGTPTVSEVWNPATGQFTTDSVTSDLFCAGHSQLADGKVFVTGGWTGGEPNGPATTRIYDPLTGSWSDGPDMLAGRYYPTNTTLGDGRVVITAGTDENGQNNREVEIYDPVLGSIDLLPGATKAMQRYPTMHLLPDGRIFHSGPDADTDILDPVLQTWEYVDTTNFGQRSHGTGDFCSVMLPPGHQEIMILGGRDIATNQGTASTEIIDLAEPTPEWRSTNFMHFKRIHPNAVVLPDGSVFVAGGGSDEFTPTYPAESFDPQTESWTVVATMKGDHRLYHSSALLLPDGRVLWAGGTTPEDNSTAEIYSPGYLFRGPRPAIELAPTVVSYGQVFSLGSLQALDIASVLLIRPGAVTHANNMSQRHVPMTFANILPSRLRVTAPSNPNVAPPGYYMLFIVDSDGVPSEARFIHLVP